MIRVIIILSILLAASFGYIVWRETTLAQGMTSEEQQALLADMDAQTGFILEAQERQHKAEMAALRAEMDQAVTVAKTRVANLQDELRTSRKALVTQARSSAKALRDAVAKASRSKPDDVTVTHDTVTLTKDNALAWVDATLELDEEVKLAAATCELRLAQQARDIRLPLEEQIHTLAQDNTALSQGSLRLKTELNMANTALRQKDDYVWKMVVVGLVAGGVALGLGYGAGYVHGKFMPP